MLQASQEGTAQRTLNILCIESLKIYENPKMLSNSFSNQWVVLASSVTNCVRFAGVGGAAALGRLSAANPHVSQLEARGNAAVYR